MHHPGFFERMAPIALQELAGMVGAKLERAPEKDALIRDVKPLQDAGPGELSFFDNRKYLPQLLATKASACLVAPDFADRVPKGTAVLVTSTPYRAFAKALQLFYPDALRPKVALATSDDPAIHPTARLEEDVRVEPTAVVGREAPTIPASSCRAIGAIRSKNPGWCIGPPQTAQRPPGIEPDSLQPSIVPAKCPGTGLELGRCPEADQLFLVIALLEEGVRDVEP